MTSLVAIHESARIESVAWSASRIRPRSVRVRTENPMFFRQMTNWRPLRHRLCSLLLLLSVCAATVPIPLASPARPAKDTSRPFPCQNRPCGCRSAEQCWKQCCCFTNAQKIAWARANHVTAPDYVYVAAAQESKSPVSRKTCCAPKSKEALCCRSESLVDETVGQGSSKVAQSDAAKPDDRESVDYVIAVMAEQCRGQSTFWNSLPWAVIPQVMLTEPCVNVEAVDHAATPALPTITYQPPAPPPRQPAVLTAI